MKYFLLFSLFFLLAGCGGPVMLKDGSVPGTQWDSWGRKDCLNLIFDIRVRIVEQVNGDESEGTKRARIKTLTKNITNFEFECSGGLEDQRALTIDILQEAQDILDCPGSDCADVHRAAVIAKDKKLGELIAGYGRLSLQPTPYVVE